MAGYSVESLPYNEGTPAGRNAINPKPTLLVRSGLRPHSASGRSERKSDGRTGNWLVPLIDDPARNGPSGFEADLDRSHIWGDHDLLESRGISVGVDRHLVRTAWEVIEARNALLRRSGTVLSGVIRRGTHGLHQLLCRRRS